MSPPFLELDFPTTGSTLFYRRKLFFSSSCKELLFREDMAAIISHFTIRKGVSGV